MTEPVRLLQLAQRYSLVPTTGAELRIFHLATNLARHMSVTHLGFSTIPGSETMAGVRVSESAEFVPVFRRNAPRAADLTRGAIGRVPFPVLHYTRDSMRRALAQRLNAVPFDIVLIESVHLGEYLPIVRGARHRPKAIVADWHNIESEVLRRYGDRGLGAMRTRYALHAARQLEQYERWFANQCDLNITVSERDRQSLVGAGVRGPVIVVDNGVDVAHFAAHAAPELNHPARHRLLYVGSMDYHANVDAVTFFAAHAWPQIRQRLPHAVFTIVGRQPRKEVLALAAQDGIEVTGSVPDTLPYYQQAFASVVPLRIAGGTRLKILESMAAEVAVVSTSRGAEGLELTPGVHYLQADEPEEMVTAVLDLAHQAERREWMVREARSVVRRSYDWPALADRMAAELLRVAACTTAATDAESVSANAG